MLQRKPIKFLTILFILVLFSSNVFAYQNYDKKTLALNTMLGNPLRIPILNGSDVVITKNNPTDLFWFYCTPIKSFSANFTHSCKILEVNK